MIRRAAYTVVLLLMFASAATAQTKEQLQEQIRQTEEELRIGQELLGKTRKDQKVSQQELKLIQSQIGARRKKLGSLEQQLTLTRREISGRNKKIEGLNNELAGLKKDYAAMTYAAYKNYKLNNFLLFLFSADDFNNATRRIYFMKRYNRMRVSRAERIAAVTDSISSEVKKLDATRADLDKTKTTHSNELAALGQDEAQYKKTVSRLTIQESKLAKEVREKQAKIDRAHRKIQEIIAEEARKSREKKTTAAEDKMALELSGQFSQNKGRLPYPVKSGVVIDKFGTHSHAVVKTTKIVNNGVNIAAGRGAEVTAVFDGTVTAIFSASVLNNCIIVRHGEYITVYANIVKVSVKTGDKVSLGQRLGYLPDGDDEDTHFLHFEVLEKGAYVNPEQWIRR